MKPVAPVMNTSFPAKNSGIRGGDASGAGRGTIVVEAAQLPVQKNLYYNYMVSPRLYTR